MTAAIAVTRPVPPSPRPKENRHENTHVSPVCPSAGCLWDSQGSNEGNHHLYPVRLPSSAHGPGLYAGGPVMLAIAGVILRRWMSMIRTWLTELIFPLDRDAIWFDRWFIAILLMIGVFALVMAYWALP